MKFVKNIAAVSTLILSLALNAHGQSVPETGSLGIRANFTGQAAIEVPYMYNEAFSLAPFIALEAIQNQSTSITIGVHPRYYMMAMSSTVTTYLTGVMSFSNISPSGNTSTNDYNLGVGYGAEYFFSDKISVSADANLNTRFGDRSSKLFTVTRVSATVYF